MADLGEDDRELVHRPEHGTDVLVERHPDGAERPVAIGRELTKRHEEMRRGRLSELAEHYRAVETPRGETVIVVGPPAASTSMAADDFDARLLALLAEHSLRDAVAALAAETGMARRTLYERALVLQNRQAAP